jgi:chromosome partitioning protein
LRIIDIYSIKGGVGKTASSMNLAGELAILGKRVLLADLDPLGASILGLTPSKNRVERPRSAEPGSLAQSVAPSSVSNLSTLFLGSIAAERPPEETALQGLAEEFRALAQNYDVTVLDSPPAGGPWVRWGMKVSHSVAAIVQSEPLAFRILPKLLDQIREARGENMTPYVEGLLLTMVGTTNDLTSRIAAYAQKRYPKAVFRTTIPRDPVIPEANYSGLLASHQNPEAPASVAYRAWAQEVIERWERTNKLIQEISGG